MNVPLSIGGINFPVLTALEIDQEYSEIAARDFRRLADGSAQLRTLYSGKLATTIKGKAWMQSVIDSIDFDDTHVIKCVSSRSIYVAGSTTVTLPSNKRTDYPAYALGIVGNNLVETTITGSTIAAVSGATDYIALYYPQFTAVITDYTTDLKSSTAEYGWSITAEQI